MLGQSVLGLLLSHCLAPFCVVSNMGALPSIWLQDGLHAPEQAERQGADTGLGGTVHHDKIAKLVHADLAVWVPSAVIREILDLRTDTKANLEMWRLGLEVCLNASALQNKLHRKAARSLFHIVVDAAGLASARGGCPDCHRVPRKLATHVVVSERVFLTFPQIVLSTQATGEAWVPSKLQFIWLWIVLFLWRIRPLVGGVERAATAKELNTKAACHFLLH